MEDHTEEIENIHKKMSLYGEEIQKCDDKLARIIEHQKNLRKRMKRLKKLRKRILEKIGE